MFIQRSYCNSLRIAKASLIIRSSNKLINPKIQPSIMSSRFPLSHMNIFHHSFSTTKPFTLTSSSNLLQVSQRLSYVRRAFTSTKRKNSKIPPKESTSNTTSRTSLNFNKNSNYTSKQSFLQRWMAHKEIPPRGTLRWYGEMALICTVFAITGTSTMVLVRPAVSNLLHLEGSLKDGPWSYRICSLVIMTPLYACMLVIVGTIFGRHFYFRHFAVKMFSRFGIPPELMDKNFHETAKHFRKY